MDNSDSPTAEAAEAPDSYTSEGKIQFDKPPGLELPQGSKDGDEVEMVATFKVEGDDLCLIAIEGIPVSKSDDKDASETAEPTPEPTDTGNDFVNGVG